MDLILIKLLIAHFIGDFFLQPSSWVAEKETKKLTSAKLYYHAMIHAGLVFAVIWRPDAWKGALFLGVVHLIIDSAKLLSQTATTKRIWFAADQLFHLISVLLCWRVFYGGALDLDQFQMPGIWLIIGGLIFLTAPVSHAIRMLIANWLPAGLNGASLHNAGKYIGMMERVLVFIFIMAGHFEAVGFLIAAKSIFRFGDLKDSHDIKLTEYVLIGTLLSFGIAVLTALAIQFLNFSMQAAVVI